MPISLPNDGWLAISAIFIMLFFVIICTEMSLRRYRKGAGYVADPDTLPAFFAVWVEDFHFRSFSAPSRTNLHLSLSKVFDPGDFSQFAWNPKDVAKRFSPAGEGSVSDWLQTLRFSAFRLGRFPSNADGFAFNFPIEVRKFPVKLCQLLKTERLRPFSSLLSGMINNINIFLRQLTSSLSQTVMNQEEFLFLRFPSERNFSLFFSFFFYRRTAEILFSLCLF